MSLGLFYYLCSTSCLLKGRLQPRVRKIVCVDKNLVSEKMNTNDRSSHPSRQQIDALLQYLERNPSLAKGFSKVASARDVARKHWERLAVQLNSMGGSAKTWKQWTKYWADKKSAIKKKAALRAAARRRTGGGVAQVVDISEVEERIISLMGGESFAIGDRHLAIDPFSEREPEQNEGLPSVSPGPSRLAEVATNTMMNTTADTNTADTNTGSGTPYQLYTNYDILDVSTETPPAMTSPPRTPSILVEHPNVHTPSRQGVHPISVSPTQHQQFRDSPLPSRLPPLRTSPRRRRRALQPLPPSPPSQRRSQLTSISDRFLRLEEQRLRLEEQRLQLDRRNTDILEAVTASFQSQNATMAQALQLMAEAVQTLAENI